MLQRLQQAIRRRTPETVIGGASHEYRGETGKGQGETVENAHDHLAGKDYESDADRFARLLPLLTGQHTVDFRDEAHYSRIIPQDNVYLHPGDTDTKVELLVRYGNQLQVDRLSPEVLKTALLSEHPTPGRLPRGYSLVDLTMIKPKNLERLGVPKSATLLLTYEEPAEFRDLY